MDLCTLPLLGTSCAYWLMTRCVVSTIICSGLIRCFHMFESLSLDTNSNLYRRFLDSMFGSLSLDTNSNLYC